MHSVNKLYAILFILESIYKYRHLGPKAKIHKHIELKYVSSKYFLELEIK